MPGITLAQAQAKLDMWLAAEEALAVSQSYEIENEGNRRQLTRANLGEVAKRVAFWNSKVVALSRSASGTSRVRYLTQ